MGLFGDFIYSLNTYIGKSLIYILIFMFFTFNFIALSIALQCHRESTLLTRISSAIFAFLFGILYIAFNYLQYRVKIKQQPCVLCGENPFLFI